MRIARHPFTRFILAAVLVVGPVAGTALARGPRSHVAGVSSLELVPVPVSDAVQNWGDQITFDVTTNETDYPVVSVLCYQSDTLVYAGSAGFYPSYPWQYAQTFTLRSNTWTGGPADCAATLKYSDGRRSHELASLHFGVEA